MNKKAEKNVAKEIIAIPASLDYFSLLFIFISNFFMKLTAVHSAAASANIVKYQLVTDARKSPVQMEGFSNSKNKRSLHYLR